jgi:hypothetical protein
MIFIVGKQLGLSAGLEDIATTTWNQLARVRIRLPSRSLGEGWCFVIPSSFHVFIWGLRFTTIRSFMLWKFAS